MADIPTVVFKHYLYTYEIPNLLTAGKVDSREGVLCTFPFS